VPWPASSELPGRPLESTKNHGKLLGKKREVQRTHHDEKRRQRRLETTASRGDRRRCFCGAIESLREREEMGRGKEIEKQGGLARALSTPTRGTEGKEEGVLEIRKRLRSFERNMKIS